MTAILEPPPVTTVDRAPASLDPVPPPLAPAPPRQEPAPRASDPALRPPRVRPVLTAGGIRWVGGALLALLVLGMAVQPTADGTEPVAPVWVQAIDSVLSITMLAALAGFVLARRWALWAGLATGAGLLALSSLCPATGHHELAAWWGVQMAVGVAMTAVPAWALATTRGQRAGSSAS